MKRITPKSQKTLKCVHVFFSELWLVGIVTLALMNLFLHPKDATALYGADLAKRFVDDFIIIPGAVGCFLTALGFSLYTKWGWLKYRWITAKWVINLFGIITGTWWLRPWTQHLPEISKRLGIAALQDPVYQHELFWLTLLGTVQAATIILAAMIGIWKPWRPKPVRGQEARHDQDQDFDHHELEQHDHEVHSVAQPVPQAVWHI
nr:hypothetical protein [uncultured Holophaga sp.]